MRRMHERASRHPAYFVGFTFVSKNLEAGAEEGESESP
jgi:hypothetical protein